MEGLAPPLKFVLELERALECGISVRMAAYRWVQNSHGEFARELRELLVCYDAGQTAPSPRQDQSFERRAVYEVLWRGLSGEPVLIPLRALREEIELASELELDEFMAKLPLRALIPLLFLIFPGFMILLFGPLIKTMLRGVL
jgi:hypothetical protein